MLAEETRHSRAEIRHHAWDSCTVFFSCCRAWDARSFVVSAEPETIGWVRGASTAGPPCSSTIMEETLGSDDVIFILHARIELSPLLGSCLDAEVQVPTRLA